MEDKGIKVRTEEVVLEILMLPGPPGTRVRVEAIFLLPSEHSEWSS
jgi:hypothetical protein